MHVLVGLGNPGAQYAANRHNIGFMAIDAIQARHGFSPWRSRFSAEISAGRIGSAKVLLIKPTTFMNLSGQAVGEAVRFYKLDAQDVTVLHDELDVDPGRTRIKRGGGHGGHNGLVSGYVLRDFPKADQPWVEALCDEVARSIELALDGKDSDLNARLNEATASFRASTSAPQREQPSKSAPQASTPKGRSHIRQARQTKPTQMPKSGPMADMLKKLLGNKDT